MDVVTRTDNPESVCNRNLIKVFSSFLCRHFAFEFSAGSRAFVIGLIFSYFSLTDI